MNIGFLFGLDNVYLPGVQIRGELCASTTMRVEHRMTSHTPVLSVMQILILRHMSSRCLLHSPDITWTMNDCHWVPEPRSLSPGPSPAHCVSKAASVLSGAGMEISRCISRHSSKFRETLTETGRGRAPGAWAGILSKIITRRNILGSSRSSSLIKVC